VRTAAHLLFAIGWIPVFVLRSERFSERRAHASPEERRAMMNAVLAVAVHVTLCELALRDPALAAPPLRLAIGMLVFGVGLAFWTLGRHTLVAYGRRLDPAVPPPTLVTSGPFAIVRHPLALGMAILALGPAVAVATPLTWTSFAVVVVTLGRRCVQDEVELRATFAGAYADYAATTPSRLIPFVW
jgi:protein-S-isoprenylcysteine O-methyltransferase Ste14